MSTPGPLDPRTAAVHAGRHDLTSMAVHAAPIDLSSTSPLPEVEAGGEAYEQLAGGGRPSEGQSFVYQRLWNPTVARFEDALAELEHTGLVVVETPANPTLELVDLDAVVAAAGDVPVLVDNTFAIPILQTLAVRVEAATRTAGEVARWLADHPEVAAVHYPGLASGADAELVARQMRGPGSMLAIRLAGGYEAASTVAQACRMIVHAVSLGGVDTLIQHPAALTHRPVPAEARPAADVLRLSVGLESAEAIIADLEQALAQLA